MAKQKGVISPISRRIKAFVIDIFLIAMPMLYITTYLILGSKENFVANQQSIFIIWLLYGVIISLFQTKTAQTPGYKASQIYLIDLECGKKASFLKCFVRYIIFVIFPFGLVFCLFRKDRLNLHDIITKTAPIAKKD
ncbi:MAG: RDD family protein [Campylobacter sp.]|nr:RDD family protein [Campylobacter sp.]